MANGYEATGTGIEGLLPGTSSGKDIPTEAEIMQEYYASMGRSGSGATGDDYLSTIGGVSPETIAKHSNPEANKKPDGDGDGVPDWADKHHGEDDHDEEEDD